MVMVATHEMPQGCNVANKRRGPEKHLGKWKKKEPKRKRRHLHLFNRLTIPAHDWCQHSFSDPLCHRLSWGQWELQQNTDLCQWRAVSRCWLKQRDPERASLWGGETRWHVSYWRGKCQETESRWRWMNERSGPAISNIAFKNQEWMQSEGNSEFHVEILLKWVKGTVYPKIKTHLKKLKRNVSFQKPWTGYSR